MFIISELRTGKGKRTVFNSYCTLHFTFAHWRQNNLPGFRDISWRCRFRSVRVLPHEWPRYHLTLEWRCNIIRLQPRFNKDVASADGWGWCSWIYDPVLVLTPLVNSPFQAGSTGPCALACQLQTPPESRGHHKHMTCSSTQSDWDSLCPAPSYLFSGSNLIRTGLNTRR